MKKKYTRAVVKETEPSVVIAALDSCPTRRRFTRDGGVWVCECCGCRYRGHRLVDVHVVEES